MQLLSRCLEVSTTKQAQWIEVAVEELSRGHKLSRSIHLAIKRCRDCNKKQLKISIDKLGIERCQGAIKVALKQFFKKKKTQI